MSYRAYIDAKMASTSTDGVDPSDICESLFPFQKDLVRFALRRGRAALFCDTGLGKSRIQLEWARHIPGRVIIATPLAVADQMVREAEAIGVECAYRRRDEGDRITVTNYEMLKEFDPRHFSGVVLDESSILKAYDGATRSMIIEMFSATPYRLACTATPAPNDHTELGNHSEFLGIKPRVEMLAEYFCHDGGETQVWRLKGHAEDAFWRWVSSWGPIVRRPSDLGYPDDGYNLPPLAMREVVVGVDHSAAKTSGFLFAQEASTLSDQRRVRRETMQARVAEASVLAAGDAPCVVWCELNDEADAVTAAIPGAVQVKGSDPQETKRQRLVDFSEGRTRVLVTKPSIAGFGLNWQHCARTVFMGASHSYEETYQAIRRFWRFGQSRQVEVFVIRAETEQAIVDNYQRKVVSAQTMADRTSEFIRDAVISQVRGVKREWNDYAPSVAMRVPSWAQGDAA